MPLFAPLRRLISDGPRSIARRGHGRSTSRFLLAIAAALAVLGAAESARAAVCTWVGAAAQPRWTTTTNWTDCNGTFPGANDSVVIASTADGIELQADRTITGLTINTGYTGTFGGASSSTAYTLTVNGNVAINAGSIGLLTAFNVTGTFTFTGTGGFTAPTTMTVTGLTTLSTSGTTTVASPKVFNANGGLRVTAGTLTASTGSTVSTTTIELTGGTFNVGGTLTGTGALTLSGGTINANDGHLITVGSVSMTSGSSAFNIPITVARTGTVTVRVAGAFSMSAGTFNPADNVIVDVVIEGDLNISGGTFTFPQGRLFIAGRFERSGSPTISYRGGPAQGTQQGRVVFNATSSKSHQFGGTTFPYVAFTDGLVGYWKLNGNGSDASGFLNHSMTGTTSASAPTWRAKTRYDNSGAYNFAKASRHHHTIPMTTWLRPKSTSLDSSATWTFSTWISPLTTDTSGSEIMNGGGDFYVRLNNAGSNVPGTVTVSMKTTGGTVTCTSDVSIPVQDSESPKYTFVAASVAPGALTVYVQDENFMPPDLYKKTCLHSSTYAYSSAGDFYIGRHPTDLLLDYDGYIDEVRFYGRALDPIDVSALGAGSQPSQAVATHTADSFTVAAELILAAKLDMGANSLTAAAWNNVGGAFSSTGTVTLSSTGNSNDLRTNDQPFYNLTMVQTGCPGSCVGSWSTKDRLRVDGTLTLTAPLTTATNYGTDHRVIRAGNIVMGSGGTLTSIEKIVLAPAAGQNLTTTLTSAQTRIRVEDPTETSLVGYWKFDEVTGTTTRDWSGSGNHGTLSGNVQWIGYTAGFKFFKDALFDNPGELVFSNGTAKTVNIDTSITTVTTGNTVQLGGTNPPSLPDTGSAQTISLWYMTIETPAADHTLLSLSTSANDVTAGTGGIRIVRLGADCGGAATSCRKIAVQRDNGTTLMTSSTQPAVNNWVHLLYTYDGVNTHKLYLDGVERASTSTAVRRVGAVTKAHVGTYRGLTDHAHFVGRFEELRIYNVQLTPLQIAGLAAKRYSGRGGTATVTLNGNAASTVSDTLGVDNGTLYTAGNTMVASHTTNAVIVNSGTLQIGSGASTFSAGLTIQPQGRLLFSSTGGSISIATGKVLTVDGTLESTTGTDTPKPIITSGGTYTFKVGSTSTSTPTLKVNGLHVEKTGTDGMWINAVDGSNATFAQFDNITFLGQGAETGPLLKIWGSTAKGLSLIGNSLTFTVGPRTPNVQVDDKGGVSGDTRAQFRSASCTAACDSYANQALNGAVVSWTGDAQWTTHSTSGSIAGFPVAAFNWDTFAQHATYVAFNDTSGTTDQLLKRDVDGNAVSSWSLPSGENFVGSPRWVWVTGDDYYVYVLTAHGRVYRLKDFSGAAGALVYEGDVYRDPGDFATATSPLMLDTTNLYWAGNGGATADTPKLISIKQNTFGTANGSISSVTSASIPSIAGGYLFFADSTNLYKQAVSPTLEGTPTDPEILSGSGAISSRVTVIRNVVYLLRENGLLLAHDASNLDLLWSYRDSANHGGSCTSGDTCTAINFFVNVPDGEVYFGDKDGHLYALEAPASGQAGELLTGYPFQPGASTDEFRVAPLYRVDANMVGVLAIGSTSGRVFFVNKTSRAVIKTYQFNGAISAIAWDDASNKYMIGTDAGRLHYIAEAQIQ